jgi:phosphoglycerate dehydrogenase-like enzyme
MPTSRPAALLAYSTAINPDTVTAAQRRQLEAMVELLRATPVEDLDDPDVHPLLARVEVLVTGWGLAPLTADVLGRAPRLRLVAHLGGTVKALLPRETWQRGIAVTHAASANALPVAEYTLAAILLSNKQAFRLRRKYGETRDSLREWSANLPRLGNYRKRIGIVGASRVGRRVAELLRPFDFEVLIHDPYLTPAEAAALGARLAALDELMAHCDVVSLHAPVTDATRGLIDRRRLALLRDGAVLINTARGVIVDQEALIDETRSGRIDAVIDVTEPDTLPADSPLYDIANVFLTPHIAGALGPETQRMTDVVLAEIGRFLRGEPLEYAVLAADLGRIA